MGGINLAQSHFQMQSVLSPRYGGHRDGERAIISRIADAVNIGEVYLS